MKRTLARVAMCMIGFTAVGVLISSRVQHAMRDTTIKLDKHGRIPARKRIEMRLEEATDTSGQRNEPLTYPAWWKKAWPRSKVNSWKDQFVGDNPLFPPCAREPPLSKEGLYGFVEPREFLPNSKNPCWYERSGKSKEFKCAPYFYLAGVAKGGTTDMFVRIRLHPDVMQGTQKEYHWWDRYRFGDTEEDDDTGAKEEATSFDEYLQQITGPELKDVENDIITEGHSTKVFGDGSPSYLWDVENWDLIDGNQDCDEPRVVIGQHIRHFYPDAKIIMTFRHPTANGVIQRISRAPAHSTRQQHRKRSSLTRSARSPATSPVNMATATNQHPAPGLGVEGADDTRQKDGAALSG
ncbi:hypothetical protein BaRGS_00008377 [Batillaria attramentaria]|uniref:Uncharacterized protein n=1 Tax=Batillaria attramentaria TaxID=370345 RepID=A0ABD0LM00_9CAEN